MRFFLLFFVMAFHIAVSGQRHYVCYFATHPPVIDGVGEEAAWQAAPWTADFGDIEGEIRPRPEFRTRTKMLWDKDYLYIYAELEEPDLWGTLRQHDTIVYLDNDFEVFIDPDNDTHNYFELEFNALNTEMDLFLAKPYRNGGRALMSWDAQGLRSAVHTRGTLNHPGDKDAGWSVEMAIPLKTLHFWGDGPVRDSAVWRINFSRVEWDREVKDGQYVVLTDGATGRRRPEHNWVWSPQGIIDMHAPEKWGYLQFSERSGGRDTVAFVPPVDEKARELLWKVYYGQRDFHRSRGRYATSLQDLGLPPAPEGYSLKMEAMEVQYTAVVMDPGGMLMIDQDGRIGRLR